MKKVVKGKESMVFYNNMRKTDKTFDTPLVARLGETVFFLNLEFKLLYDNKEILTASAHRIIKGTVCEIDCATDCSTRIHIRADDSGKIYGGVQELFFHSFKDAEKVATEVNRYTEAHLIWEGDWYEIYKGLFQASYLYTLKFPLHPLQVQKVWKEGGWHYIIPKRVIANIGNGETHIKYLSNDTKLEYMFGRPVLKLFEVDYSNKYEIVPRTADH
ncbi:MAG: hypothetical protein HFJ55_03380 [Clostridia bacterium]|jgi:hypothetical protein|nr:hypothetical protein [Clostridia bacterium]